MFTVTLYIVWITGLLGVMPTSGQTSSCGSACIGSQGYCPGSYTTGSTCVDGRCRCLNNPNRDECTCLGIDGNCRITQGASVRVGTPTYAGSAQTTYSCVADDNCNYDVHVIANYESNGHTGFRVHNTGNTRVNLAVTGTSSKPLILVFVSYEPVRWTLSIPSGVVIDRVILRSYYIDTSYVVYSPGQVLTVERISRSSQTFPTGHGPDTGGGNTLRMLQYLSGRFGPVSSFSGSYRADSWTLQISRQNRSGCTSPTVTSGTVAMATTHWETTVTTLASTVTPTSSQSSSCGSSCIGSRGYCPGSYIIGQTCVGGRCRCLNNPNRDECTCLAIDGNCRITQGASVRVGTPTYTGRAQTTYSCVANDNCNYDVHVIANYESNGHTGFRVHNTGNTGVNLRVTGTSTKPLILVFVSYEPVRWTLSIPSGVVIDRVILSSYYLDNSSVVYSPGQVLTVERIRSSSRTIDCAYGSDTGGCNTLRVLQYLRGRFGPVSSFSGSYRADSWTLQISRRNGCTSPTITSRTAITSTIPHQSTTATTLTNLARSCQVTQGASVRVGTPTYAGRAQTTYSCVVNNNCNYDVHVIVNYESNGHTGFRVHNTGNTRVNLRVTGTSTKPLILVFISYEPVRWTLSIPSGVVIDRVILSSYYLDRSSVIYSPGQVVTLERSNYQTLPSGYRGGSRTLRVLQYLRGRFGPVSSLSGSYRADSWTLQISRQNRSVCTTHQTEIDTSSEGSTCSAVVCGAVVGGVVAALMLILVTIIAIAIFAVVKRKQYQTTTSSSSHNHTSAATTNPSEGVVPTTSPSNNTGYWVGIGWVEFDKNFGKSMNEQKNEGPISPPPQYEEL